MSFTPEEEARLAIEDAIGEGNVFEGLYNDGEPGRVAFFNPYTKTETVMTKRYILIYDAHGNT